MHNPTGHANARPAENDLGALAAGQNVARPLLTGFSRYLASGQWRKSVFKGRVLLGRCSEFPIMPLHPFSRRTLVAAKVKQFT